MKAVACRKGIAKDRAHVGCATFDSVSCMLLRLLRFVWKGQKEEMEAAQRTNGALVQPGTVVWGRVKGFPWWPGLVVPYELVLFLPAGADVPTHDPAKVVLQFFSDGRISLLKLRDIQLFVGNEDLVHGAGRYKGIIERATNAAQAWIAAHGSGPNAGGAPGVAVKRLRVENKANEMLLESYRRVFNECITLLNRTLEETAAAEEVGSARTPNIEQPVISQLSRRLSTNRSATAEQVVVPEDHFSADEDADEDDSSDDILPE